MNVIVRNIPNSITCLNLLSGCFACIYAIQGDYNAVALLIGLSALFDFMDGLAARLLHAYSPLGKELDSLADLISFGLAPGLMVLHFLQYNSTFQGAEPGQLQSLLCYSALIIPVFSGLRLAKFNIDTRQTTSFLGLPVPANALFWIGLCLTGLAMDTPLNGYLTIALILLFSWLLVSEVPMFSLKFKSLGIRENAIRYLLLIASALLLLFFQLSGLAAVIGLYIILSILTARKQ